jgi:hypothetical protein
MRGEDKMSDRKKKDAEAIKRELEQNTEQRFALLSALSLARSNCKHESVEHGTHAGNRRYTICKICGLEW